MKLEVSPKGKTVIDDHEDNFAIVFAAMGVSCRGGEEGGSVCEMQVEYSSGIPLIRRPMGQKCLY